ncbi:MAG: hypothetical protein GY723_10265 [bacterium]|nr:hypothetical protein [bacterium]MCP5070506.1 hypothetical protein [bacterium]
MKRVFVGLLLVLAGTVAWFLPRILTQTNVGAGYVAKQACSCIFVGERSLASCRADMMPEMEPIEAELLETGVGVRAWVPLLAERIARYKEPYGCTLEP